MFPSYRNQSVDLQSKSTNWFLYDGNIGRLWKYTDCEHYIEMKKLIYFNLLDLLDNT